MGTCGPRAEMCTTTFSAQVEVLPVDAPTGYARAAEVFAEAADHAGRAAEEDRQRVRVRAGGGQGLLGGQAPFAAVDDVRAHHGVASGQRPDFPGVGRGGPVGGVEEVDRAAQGLAVHGAEPAEEPGDADTA